MINISSKFQSNSLTLPFRVYVLLAKRHKSVHCCKPFVRCCTPDGPSRTTPARRPPSNPFLSPIQASPRRRHRCPCVLSGSRKEVPTNQPTKLASMHFLPLQKTLPPPEAVWWWSQLKYRNSCTHSPQWNLGVEEPYLSFRRGRHNAHKYLLAPSRQVSPVVPHRLLCPFGLKFSICRISLRWFLVVATSAVGWNLYFWSRPVEGPNLPGMVMYYQGNV